MESSLHLRATCFILQKKSPFPVLVSTVFRNHSLGIFNSYTIHIYYHKTKG